MPSKYSILLFEPLGMKSTHLRDDHAEIVKGMAYGYVPSGDTIRRIALRKSSLRMSQGVGGSGVELKPLSDTRFRPVGQPTRQELPGQSDRFRLESGPYPRLSI